VSDEKKAIYIDSDGTLAKTIVTIGNERIYGITKITYEVNDAGSKITLEAVKSKLSVISDKIPVHLKPEETMKIKSKFVTSSPEKYTDMESNDPVQSAPPNSKPIVKAYMEAFAKAHPTVDCFVTKTDKMVIKPIFGKYTAEELKDIMTTYVTLKDPFLKERGYPLSLLIRNMQQVLFRLQSKTSDEGSKVYKNEDYVKTMPIKQLWEYVIGKNENKWTGSEDWAKSYEEEIRRRNVRLVDIPEDEYQKIRKNFLDSKDEEGE